MPVFFDKSNAPSYVKAPSGMAKNYPDPTASDCQLAIAVLKRAGVGAMYLESAGTHPTYNAGALAGTNAKPTGPFFSVSANNNVRGDLYLKVVIQLTWTSGASCSREITYDIDYGDMTVVDAYSWQSGSTQTNIDSSYGQLITFDTHPTAGTGFSYERTGTYPSAPTYTQSLNADATVATLTWSGGTENNGTVHYGATLTITLSNKRTFKDYADASVAMLSQVTFNDESSNPTKTYATSGSFRPAGNYYLRWLKNWNATGTPNWSNWTTNLIVLRSRTTGTGYTFKFFPEVNPWVSAYTGATYAFKWTYSPWTNKAYIDSGSGLAIDLPKNILCAYGFPMDSSARLNFGATLSPPTQTLLTPYIMSAKSRMRSDGDLTNNGIKYIYTEGTNTWTTFSPPQKYLPNGQRDVEYAPSLLNGSYGYVIAQIEKPRYCRPFYYDGFSGYYPFQTITKSFGSTQSFQSFTTNKNLGIPGDTANGIENVAATWSLVSMTGGIVSTDLAVAPDGKSAIFTANHHGTCRLKCTYPNADYYTPLITVP